MQKTLIFTSKNLLKIILIRLKKKKKHTQWRDKLRGTEVKQNLIMLSVVKKKKLEHSKVFFFPTNNK